MQDHTLIIPTFNRPVQLERLLRSLERQGLESHVLIADSGSDENHALNAGAVARSRLKVSLLRFPSDMMPFEKFYQAACRAESTYVSMCADDDFLVVPSLSAILQHLRQHADCVAAHGWYYTFYETHQLGITSVVYSGTYEEADALSRLHALCARYEAVTYAVYRTTAMRDVLGEVRALPTILSKEFGAGALTVLTGKVARVPVLYYGRSLGPSEQYSNWHPLEMLGTRPMALFGDYMPYRGVLVARLAAAMGIEPERAGVLADLAHLRYLSDYTKPPVLDYLFDRVAWNTPKDAMMRDVWPVLAMAGASVGGNGYSLRKLVARRVAHTFLPEAMRARIKRLFVRPQAVQEDQILRRTTATGLAREYFIYSAFRQALLKGLDRESECGSMVAAMDTYD